MTALVKVYLEAFMDDTKFSSEYSFKIETRPPSQESQNESEQATVSINKTETVPVPDPVDPKEKVIPEVLKVPGLPDI